MFDRNRSSRWNLSVGVAAGGLLLLIYLATATPAAGGLRDLVSTVAHGDADAPVNQSVCAADLAADLEMPEDAPGSMYIDYIHDPFQDDLSNPHPAFHTHLLRTYRPHNWAGPGQRTIGTVLTSRHGSLQDPYFLAAEQLVYRMLWDPRIKSQYTFTVFVAPFIHDEKRDLLRAAGANVRELPLIQWNATDWMAMGRWRDLFIKLNIWALEDFEAVALLDLDAFPIENIDGIFDELQEQTCDRAKLVDLEDIEDTCRYTFAAVKHENVDEFNAGVLVTRPHRAMHARLRRHMKTENFTSGGMEQAFLNSFFRPDGPFPAQYIDRKWNGFLPHESEIGEIKVFHDKLWSAEWLDRYGRGWAKGWFNETWDDMLRLYESDAFVAMREADGERMY